MSDLNESQRRIAETLDGLIVVDAGPGTGKTHTIVERYINIISQEGVEPTDVLLLTFTRNAAAEMETRIKGRLNERMMPEAAKKVQARTFDSFCLSVVMEFPESAGRMFGLEETLTHSVRLVENETLNRAYFRSFLNQYMDEHSEDLGEWGAVLSQYQDDIYDLINRLMSKGVYPMRRGWFGGDDGRVLVGDPSALLELLNERNRQTDNKGSDLRRAFFDHYDSEKYDHLDTNLIGKKTLDSEILVSAATEDRRSLIDAIHGIYWHYIQRSVRDDRLTFGICAMLAFSVLYDSQKAREDNSFKYVMIDEFQDTNASQIMTVLMILEPPERATDGIRQPNLCVVGDWKQGIYGFRYVSTEYIRGFTRMVAPLRSLLLEDGQKRVRVDIADPLLLPLDVNYRSSQAVVDASFLAPRLPAVKEEEFDHELELTELTAFRDEEIGERTEVRMVSAASKDSEEATVADCIREYMGSDRYAIVRGGEERPMRLGDIAVLCRKGSQCRAVLDRLTSEGIPAYLQGDVEVMSTREGKLALAWLRYVNNDQDLWGIVPIMADLGYSMLEIEAAVGRKDANGKTIWNVPPEIRAQRQDLYNHRRRVTELLSRLYAWYGLDNDVTQTIISVLSSAHRDSLLTISDLIVMIEDDIKAKTVYQVEADNRRDAVVIMTMHKAKGLEFPAVIIPYVDKYQMPLTKGDSSAFLLDDLAGLRCRRTVDTFGEYTKICKSWRTQVVSDAIPKDYSEEKRLMFVAMSRAEQYITIIHGPEGSKFIKGLGDAGIQHSTIEEFPGAFQEAAAESAPMPDVSSYRPRPRTLGVHGVMRLDAADGMGGMSESDEVCGKGKEYGTEVHEEARRMEQGGAPSGRYPEAAYIRDAVLSRKGLDGFLRADTEIACVLPVEEGGFALRGVMDLIMLFEDRIEIHDYKTDVTDRFQAEYEIQLSVYAEVARRIYGGKPVRCFIDYVSQGRTVEFDPIPWARLYETIGPRAEEYLERMRARTDSPARASVERVKYGGVNAPPDEWSHLRAGR